MSGYDTDVTFMKLWRPWWDVGCDACGVSEGDCECKANWEAYTGKEGSIPKWWGWLIAPKDLVCRFCGRTPSTYDGCCRESIAYLKYRYAVIFFPEWVPGLLEARNASDEATA